MRELGIDPPPKQGIGAWLSWSQWFQRLRDATPKVQTFTATLDPSSVAANTTEEKTFTVNGLSTSDIVYVNKPSHQAGLGIVNCRVSASNTLAITFANNSGSAIDPAYEDYLIASIRR